MLLIDEFPSPIGRIAVAARAGRLCALEFGPARLSRQLAARFPDVPQRRVRNPFGLSARIRRYLKGDLAVLDRILVETGGTVFQQRVWRALRRIPVGGTMTYGALARALGRGAAARAVGAANGRNPVSVVVPCHRLIGGDDSLTGYGGGLWRKRWLLRHEGAAPARALDGGLRPPSEKGNRAPAAGRRVSSGRAARSGSARRRGRTR